MVFNYTTSCKEKAYFGRVEYPPSFEKRAIVFDLSLCSVLLRLGSDSEKRKITDNIIIFVQVSKNRHKSQMDIPKQTSFPNERSVARVIL
jgi:hypothetical protein